MSLPPLVEPGADLDAGEVARYSRHLLLPEVGRLGQRRLKNARVLVIGAGGLGSPVLMYLAAAGVGTIGIVDDDVVELSNLARQVIHGESRLGHPKVDSAATRIAEINPGVAVVRHPVRLRSDNALDLIAGYHLVLDGTDNFATRYLVDDACSVLGLPLVWGSILRYDGQVSVFWSAPPQGSDGQGGEPMTYRDLHPVPPPAGSVPSCAEGGVLGMICAAIGAVMATEAVKLICGLGRPLLGRLMTFDALAMDWVTIPVRRPEGAGRVVALESDYDAFCGLSPVAAPLRGVSAGPEPSSSISVEELDRLLRQRTAGTTDFVLVDVREPAERDIARIPGAIGIPLPVLRAGSAGELLTAAAQGRRIILYCRSGARSAQALRIARQAGFADAVDVDGGVLAWIERIDPSQPRY